MGAACEPVCGTGNLDNRNKQVNIVNGPSISMQPNIEIEKRRKQDVYFKSFTKRNIKEIYKFERILGSGHFGNVYKAYYLKDHTRKYAIKSISRDKLTDRSLDRLHFELSVLKNMDHPNIIKYHATYVDEKYVHIVSELCTGGELFSRLEKQGSFTEKEAAVVIYQCLLAVKYIHSKQVAHRDLKPENIVFVSKDSLEIKIIDFGLSKEFEKEEGLKSVVGTPYYVAPEILTADYDERCDVWSLGVILFILLCGYPPFNGKTSREVIAQIRRGRINFDQPEWRGVSRQAKRLVF